MVGFNKINKADFIKKKVLKLWYIWCRVNCMDIILSIDFKMPVCSDPLKILLLFTGVILISTLNMSGQTS